MVTNYRTLASVHPGPHPPGCQCGTSLEVRQAYAAIGGWWHTEECKQWKIAVEIWKRTNELSPEMVRDFQSASL